MQVLSTWRVRSVQKFLGWLIASHGISFPVHWRQLTEYLQVRYSEPCVRGSLKLVHSSYIFLQEVAGIEDKLTDSAMYVVALKELMSQASPGKPPRQAPRFPTILLAAFEDMVLAGDKPVFLRVLSWWLLVQSWGTLRFDDHRGLLPRDFVVTSTGLQARLTRSKVSGSDKHLNFRTVIIHPSAYIQRKDWLAVGWKLLLEGAPHERDYLLPAPTNNFQGFKIKELKYSTAFAVQTHIISTASYRGCESFSSIQRGTIIRRTAAATSCHQRQQCWVSPNLNAIYLEDGPLREVSGTPEQPSIKSRRCKLQ